MSAQAKRIDGGRRAAVVALMSVAVLITASGLFFGVYCFMYGISYTVLNTQVSGGLFGLVAAFLGGRYCVSTYRLSKRLAEGNQPFRWNHSTDKNTRDWRNK